MHAQLAIALVIVVVAAAVGAYFMTRSKKQQKEQFTVLYPSNEKLKQSWDKSAILTAVLPNGKLR